MTRQEALAVYRRHGLLLAQMTVREDVAEKLAELEAERDKARADYQFMVERAADQKLDGYRELGARAAAAENERDTIRSQVAELEASEGRLLGNISDLQDTLDEMAAAVAPVEVIGEHTNANQPWKNALELITPAAEVKELRARVAELGAHLASLQASEADRLGYARKFTPAEVEIAQLRARVVELSEQRAQALDLANSLASESDTMRMLHDIATAKSPNIKTASTNLAIAICDILLAWLEAHGAENYIELTMADSEASTGLTFTVRRNDRPTPQTMRAKAEKERDEALARLASLESARVPELLEELVRWREATCSGHPEDGKHEERFAADRRFFSVEVEVADALIAARKEAPRGS